MEEKYIKQFIEDMLSDRYNRQKPDDIEVPDAFFNLVIETMKPVIDNLKNSYIPGFAPEDLEDLFMMRTHQCLRRGLFDTHKLPFGFFSVVYRNIIWEINRIRERELKKGIRHSDAMDNLVKWRSNDTEQGENILLIDES